MTNKFKVITPKKDVLEKQAWDLLKKQVESKLKNIECPDHHEHPRVTVSGSSKNPKFSIEGCCQKLIDSATEALK